MNKSVLHVSEATGWTGGLARLLETSIGLKKKGWKIAVACAPDSDLVAPSQEAGFSIVAIPIRQDYDIFAARKLADYMRRYKVPLLHAHHPKAHAVSLLTKTMMRWSGDTPAPILVVSRRVSYSVGKNPFSAWKYRSTLIDRYVAVAESVKNDLAAAGVDRERVTVIRSGVDMEKFTPRRGGHDLKDALGIPDGARTVVLIGNAAVAKGHPLFLDAMKIVLDAVPQAHALLVGRDTDADWIKERVDALGISSSVTLAGYRTDVPEILSFADVSVNAAIAGEALSGALRESLAMEVPVVASDLSGNGELVKEGETGKLFTPGDAPAMALAIIWTLEHFEEAAGMARWGRQVVGKGFSLQAAIEGADRLYTDLLELSERL